MTWKQTTQQRHISIIIITEVPEHLLPQGPA